MNPSKLQSLLQSGVVHHRAGRLAEAETIYRQVRALVPKNFDVLHLSGLVAYQQERLPEAVDLLTRAMKIDPRSHVCEMRLGLALLAAGKPAEAEARFRHAVETKPDFAEGWDNLAYLLKTQDRLLEAIPCHEKAVTLRPTGATAWYNYGLTLSLTGRYTEALACHERSLAADPNYAMARFGLAQVLHQLDRIPEAVENYRAFLALKPNHHEARSYLLFALHCLDGVDRDQLFAEHVAFGRAVGNPPAAKLPNTPEPGRRLRVAVLSPDLRTHSCAYFIEPLLRGLDPAQFELCLYHDHFRTDAVSERLKSLAVVWRNFVGHPPAAVEKAIRGDAPDILIDLAGHTGMTNRLPLFARRLAPVQITYLGYPNTTGLPAMDFRFTDAIADPPGEADRFATEQLVRFAPCAWTYSPPLDAPAPVARHEAAARPLVFGCFNTLAKVTDEILTLWGHLLAALPDARLLLKGAGLQRPEIRERYRERFARLELPVDRIDLLGRTPDTASHLAIYNQVDIALDTFPYHGTTTTCEAMWMGVPVVTLAGDRHMSRVGVSLLNAVGHPEWVATSVETYLQIATDLAADRARLDRWRRELRDELKRSVLLDQAGQAASFATALRGCWAAWCARQTMAG